MNNSLKQYLELYDEQHRAIEEHSIEALNRWRAEARRVLGDDSVSLPTHKTEGYEKTSINEMMAPDLGVNINRLNFNAQLAATFKCDIPNMSTLLGVVVNDVFHAANTLQKNLPEGVIFDSFRNVARTHPEILERYYGSEAPLDSAAVALNTLMAQDGIVIYIPSGTEMKKGLQLVNIFASPTPLAAFRRVLIVVGDNASGRLLMCDHTQGKDVEFISSQVIEVILGRNSRLDLYDVEKSNSMTARHNMVFVHQSEGSNILANSTTLTCGTTRNEIVVNIEGEHCETRLTGMAIADAKQHIDNQTVVNHHAAHCHSNQLYKYVLEDEAQGAFEGSINVMPEAPYTEAYQSNKNILGSESAKMHTKPQLLIYNDEVKCSHGATTGQLDQDALFYMRTRGIPESEARNMLMQAFMVDVIESVRQEALRDRLRHMVERRFCGGGENCSTCNISHEK